MKREIHDCVQGNLTIGTYYTKLKSLWDEQSSFVLNIRMQLLNQKGGSTVSTEPKDNEVSHGAE